MATYCGSLLAADRRAAARCSRGSRPAASTATRAPGDWPSPGAYELRGRPATAPRLRRLGPRRLRAAAHRDAPNDRPAATCCSASRWPTWDARMRRSGGRAGVALRRSARIALTGLPPAPARRGSTSWWASRSRRWTSSSRCSRSPYYLSPAWLRIDPDVRSAAEEPAVPEVGWRRRPKAKCSDPRAPLRGRAGRTATCSSASSGAGAWRRSSSPRT